MINCRVIYFFAKLQYSQRSITQIIVKKMIYAFFEFQLLAYGFLNISINEMQLFIKNTFIRCIYQFFDLPSMDPPVWFNLKSKIIFLWIFLLSTLLNHSFSMELFATPWKQETVRFSHVFKEVEKRCIGNKGLTEFCFLSDYSKHFIEDHKTAKRQLAIFKLFVITSK